AAVSCPPPRECTKVRPAAARRIDHSNRAAGGWEAMQASARRPVSSNALLGSQSPPLATPASRDGAVDQQVDENHEQRERELNFAGEGARVDDRQQVVLNESAGIARGAREAPELVLERGKRTEPPGDLDEDAPDRCGAMKEGEPPAVEGKKAAEDHEYDEDKMRKY